MWPAIRRTPRSAFAADVGAAGRRHRPKRTGLRDAASGPCHTGPWVEPSARAQDAPPPVVAQCPELEVVLDVAGGHIQRAAANIDPHHAVYPVAPSGPGGRLAPCGAEAGAAPGRLGASEHRPRNTVAVDLRAARVRRDTRAERERRARGERVARGLPPCQLPRHARARARADQWRKSGPAPSPDEGGSARCARRPGSAAIRW